VPCPLGAAGPGTICRVLEKAYEVSSRESSSGSFVEFLAGFALLVSAELEAAAVSTRRSGESADMQYVRPLATSPARARPSIRGLDAAS